MMNVLNNYMGVIILQYMHNISLYNICQLYINKVEVGKKETLVHKKETLTCKPIQTLKNVFCIR